MSIERGKTVTAAIDIRTVGNTWVRPEPSSIAVRTTIDRGTEGEIADVTGAEIRVKFFTGYGISTQVDDVWIARQVFGTYVVSK